MKRWIVLAVILLATSAASLWAAGVSYTNIPGRGEGVLLYYQNADGTYELVTSDTPLKVTGTVAATGTFYQTTQPVSNQALTDAQSMDTGMKIKFATAAGTLPALADVTLVDSQTDLTLTDTATVYSYTLPAKCVAYEFQARGTGVVDYSWVDTTVATYTTLKSGYPYNTFGLGSEKLFSGKIYFKCPLTAGEVMEIHAIYKP